MPIVLALLLTGGAHAGEGCTSASHWGVLAQVGALTSTLSGLAMGTAVGLQEGNLAAQKPLYTLGRITAGVGLPTMAVGGVGMLATAKGCEGEKRGRVAGVAFVLSAGLAVPMALVARGQVADTVDAAAQDRTGAAVGHGAATLGLLALPVASMAVGLRQTGQMRNAGVRAAVVVGPSGARVTGTF
ncbi:MAG: hypothetical protein KC656_09000 [Myxococcales bacterium]|nr:hypothetical protein [Myxococcales bacterium]